MFFSSAKNFVSLGMSVNVPKKLKQGDYHLKREQYFRLLAVSVMKDLFYVHKLMR